jgi:hypothetical protein
MDKDQAAMVALRMAAATRLVGRFLTECELTEDERAAMGDILSLIAARMSDASVRHFSNAA